MQRLKHTSPNARLNIFRNGLSPRRAPVRLLQSKVQKNDLHGLRQLPKLWKILDKYNVDIGKRWKWIVGTQRVENIHENKEIVNDQISIWKIVKEIWNTHREINNKIQQNTLLRYNKKIREEKRERRKEIQRKIRLVRNKAVSSQTRQQIKVAVEKYLQSKTKRRNQTNIFGKSKQMTKKQKTQTMTKKRKKKQKFSDKSKKTKNKNTKSKGKRKIEDQEPTRRSKRMPSKNMNWKLGEYEWDEEYE